MRISDANIRKIMQCLQEYGIMIPYNLAKKQAFEIFDVIEISFTVQL